MTDQLKSQGKNLLIYNELQEWEIEYWTKKFSCSREQLRKALEVVIKPNCKERRP